MALPLVLLSPVLCASVTDVDVVGRRSSIGVVWWTATRTASSQAPRRCWAASCSRCSPSLMTRTSGASCSAASAIARATSTRSPLGSSSAPDAPLSLARLQTADLAVIVWHYLLLLLLCGTTSQGSDRWQPRQTRERLGLRRSPWRLHRERPPGPPQLWRQRRDVQVRHPLPVIYVVVVVVVFHVETYPTHVCFVLLSSCWTARATSSSSSRTACTTTSRRATWANNRARSASIPTPRGTLCQPTSRPTLPPSTASCS